nr:ubiquitin hydrolase [Tanacetum cinerariifolium]
MTMVKSSSCSENKPCCSKDCKKNTGTLNKKITELSDKLFDANNMVYYYKLALAQVESRLKLETLKQEREGVDGKLAGLLTASKDLDNLIESQRADKNKEGLEYSVVPPPPAQLYYSPKKDLSWTGLPEFKDDTVTEASSTAISPKSFIKFIKPNDSPSKSKTDKSETPKKPPVKYAEQYRKTNKKPTVKGNQRNWNNLKSHQLGLNFVLKKKACYNCGDFNHLAYDCRKGVKHGTSRSHVNTHKSFISRPDRVQRLERELKARAHIHNVDRVRSRPVMAWVSKKD